MVSGKMVTTLMRTTLTLDDRLFKELKTLAVETNAPFKEVVDRALRAGVDSLRGQARRKPYRVKTYHLGPPLPGVNLVKALALAGSAAFYRKDYAGALRHWEKMAQLAPNSDFVQQIQGGIDEARKLMGGPSVATAAAQPATTPRATSTTGASVSGTVTLAASLAGKASPDDALFVFARPAEGPRMPLAMIRKQVRDLPLTFKLDDSMAMSPAARLSSAERVVVGARISKRGDATAQPGDLQGLSAPVSPGAAGLKLEISEVVKP
jgi:cytochrome c-type biogenesis protein CcmH